MRCCHGTVATEMEFDAVLGLVELCMSYLLLPRLQECRDLAESSDTVTECQHDSVGQPALSVLHSLPNMRY